jgi:hypothetical protein
LDFEVAASGKNALSKDLPEFLREMDRNIEIFTNAVCVWITDYRRDHELSDGLTVDLRTHLAEVRFLHMTMPLPDCQVMSRIGFVFLSRFVLSEHA